MAAYIKKEKSKSENSLKLWNQNAKGNQSQTDN